MSHFTVNGLQVGSELAQHRRRPARAADVTLELCEGLPLLWTLLQRAAQSPWAAQPQISHLPRQLVGDGLGAVAACGGGGRRLQAVHCYALEVCTRPLCSTRTALQSASNPGQSTLLVYTHPG